MNGFMLGLLAETPIHAGAGRSTDVVDLPVAREAGTDYPLVVGSSLKGALRDRARTEGRPEHKVTQWFGDPNCSGGVLFSEGRLLLLPVRSLTGAYRWATCPLLLERLLRDLGRVGLMTTLEIPTPAKGTVLTADATQLFLEERLFAVAGQVPQPWLKLIAPLMHHQSTRQRLAATIAVLHNDDFAWFARYGLTIQARNLLEEGTKSSKNLWYEETLPCDTLMYTMIFERAAAEPFVSQMFPPENPYLQVGGNETVGQGWFAVTPYAPAAEAKP